MKSILTIFLAIALFSANKTHAQLFSTDNRQEEQFMYEVKIIDEFIERFNDDKSSFLRQEYEKQGKSYNISRTQLLVTLFNLSNQKLISADTSAKEFVHFVTNPLHPRFLSFTDSDWYAKTNCYFTYNQKTVQIPIIFHIKTLSNHGSKWMICGIGDSKVLDETVLKPVFYNTKYETNSLYLPTSSHATNFVELNHVFSGDMNPIYYFDPAVMNSPKGKKLIQLILENKLKYKYTKDIKFEFYQVDNWIFSVDQFSRATNSGWLINHLEKADKKKKELLRAKLLNI